MLKKTTSAIILTAICSITNAQATPTGAPIKGGTCWANIGLKVVLDPATVFACEHIGKTTLSQIYEKGFRVVSMIQNPAHPDFISLIIEEQK
jgi:hypothetical protein